MELGRVKELIKLLDESDLSHLEVEDDQGHVVLEKKINVITQQSNPSKFPVKVDQKKALKTIKAPFVGTFYVSEKPQGEPLVKPGDEIKKGQAIGIIEAMKMMNVVKSDVDGIIDDVLVNDGDAVEYDQSLFTLKD
jgi:Biotin carboxyl carrier protein